MTNVEKLQAQKSQILDLLLDLTDRPKPDYNVNGRSFSWTAYQSMLMEQLKLINELLQMEQPFEFRTVAL